MTRSLFLLCALLIFLPGCAHRPPPDSVVTAEADIHRLMRGTWYEKSATSAKSYTKFSYASNGKVTIRDGATRTAGTWRITGTSLEEQIGPAGSVTRGKVLEISPRRVLIMWKEGDYSTRYRSTSFKDF